MLSQAAKHLQMLSYMSSKINNTMKREAGQRNRWQAADIWQGLKEVAGLLTRVF